MSRCIFCEIAGGRSPASVFYQDDVVLGFMDHGPVNPGHTMIIPRRHAAALAELDEETGRHIWTMAQRTAAALRVSGLRCEGVNLILADSAAAFQDVLRVHLHAFPRYAGDSFKISADWGTVRPRVELDAAPAQIRLAYHRLWFGHWARERL